jgi:hypothetical protein
MFLRLIGVDDDINGVEVGGVCPMPRQDELRQCTLQRSKPEDSCGIVTEDELVHPVAEPADAVVEQDGVSHRDDLDDSSICSEKNVSPSGAAGWPILAFFARAGFHGRVRLGVFLPAAGQNKNHRQCWLAGDVRSLTRLRRVRDDRTWEDRHHCFPFPCKTCQEGKR